MTSGDAPRREPAAPERAQQVGVEHQPDDRARCREQCGQEVAEEGGGEEDRRERAVSPGAQAGRDDPEEHQRDREAEREGELAGEGREEVPPVDGEARLEEERKCRGGQARRPRVAQPGELPEGPGTHREEECPEDGHQLEGDVVVDERVEHDGDQSRQREVEGVEGKAVVPARVPPGQPAVRQQIGLQIRRQRDVCPGVTARGGGRGQQEGRVQLAECHHGDTDDRDHVGPDRPGAPAGQPADE